MSGSKPAATLAVAIGPVWRSWQVLLCNASELALLTRFHAVAHHRRPEDRMEVGGVKRIVGVG
jgi:hypothetical protein